MKSLVLGKVGTVSGFVTKEIHIPQIKDDEMLVKVQAVSLNPSDYQTAEYLKSSDAHIGHDIVLGLDVAGLVTEVGKNVKRFKRGDRVFYMREMSNPYGGFAEFSVTRERFTTMIPDNISYAEAAVLPGAGFTAYHIMYQRFHLTEGNSVLVHGGAGGVGSYAIQLAKLNNLKVFTTASSKNQEYVHNLGADVFIDYGKEDVYKRIKEETGGQGVNYIISSIGPGAATKDLEILAFGGELAAVQGLPKFDQWRFYEKGITVHEIAFGIYQSHPYEKFQHVPAEIAEELSRLVSERKIDVPKTTIISFEEIPDWLNKMQTGNVTGKIVAQMD